MNTLQNVYDKLNSKTELAKHEVELAIIDDLNKTISEAQRVINLQEDGLKWYNKAKEAHKQFLIQLSDSIGIIQSSEKYIPKLPEQIQSITSKLSKQANELGLDAKQIKGYIEALNLYGELTENAGRSKDFLKELQKFK
jgi:DNA repair ATPase RecN